MTFLFSDIEGSTRLAGALADEWPEVLEQHRRILRDCFGAHDGCEVKTEGDGFFVAFASARDAVLAAADAQRGIDTHPWPEEARVRVRIGIHTGDATVVDDDYVGLAVHHAARVSSAAHGGQIVISDATRQVVGDPGGDVSLVALGAHRLKDIDEPILLHQVNHPELQDEFPPLRALGVPTNLPAQLTSFVGRDEELRTVEKLLGAHRLVTLTGAGGAGKTRLALETAGSMKDQFVDGVWLVELARVTESTMVWQAVADVLGPRDPGEGEDHVSKVTSHFAGRRALLILDNCEHVITAVADLADTVLRAAAELRVLATSREALGIAGEHAWRVPSLEVPDLSKERGEDAWASTAVRLFIERAESVGAPIGRSCEELASVLQICRRLDGMPLAIELAAARARSLTPAQLAERLDDRFRLLTGGSRTALPRQQTLQALVDWSYELLDDRERAVLRRASVFVGGFTLEGAERVCAGGCVDALDVVDVLDGLVAKSLVVPTTAGDGRFRMLETIRSYGRQKLLAADEVAVVREAHLKWIEEMAAGAAVGLGGGAAREWLVRLESEVENLRAALEWATESPGSGRVALRVLGGTWQFWHARGRWTEARQWCERALSVAPDAVPQERAWVLWLAGYLATLMGDHEAAEAAHGEQLALSEAVDDADGAAAALYGLGFLEARRGDRRAALQFCGRGADLAEQAHNDLFLGRCLLGLGQLRRLDDLAAGVALLERAAAVGRRSNDGWTQATAEYALANVAHQNGDLVTARRHLDSAFDAYRAGGDFHGSVLALENLSLIELWEGNLDEADRLASEAVSLCRASGLDGLSVNTRTIRVLTSIRRADPDSPALLQGLITSERLRIADLNQLVWEATRQGCAALVPTAIEALIDASHAATGRDAVLALQTVGEALWSSGDRSAADYFERARRMADAEAGTASAPNLGLARCALDDGDATAAAELLAPVLEYVWGRESADSALCASAETLAALGRTVGAARLVGAAVRSFWPKTPPYDRERAAAVEKVVRGELGEAADAELAALEGASQAEIAAAFTAAVASDPDLAPR